MTAAPTCSAVAGGTSRPSESLMTVRAALDDPRSDECAVGLLSRYEPRTSSYSVDSVKRMDGKGSGPRNMSGVIGVVQQRAEDFLCIGPPIPGLVAEDRNHRHGSWG